MISKDGDRLIIETEPKQKNDLFAWLATLEPLTEEDMLPEIDDRPAEPFEL